jgi:hypothetical protein
MDKQLLIAHVRQIEEIRQSVSDLNNPKSIGDCLIDYHYMARQKISSFPHGERDKFYVPYHTAINKLDGMLDEGEGKFSTAFKTSKTKLLSILDRYIKSIHNAVAHPD